MNDTFAMSGASPPAQRILTGDCLVLLRAMPAASIDVIVTSPPYNLGIAYNSYKDSLPRTEYLAWMVDVAIELARVLKPAGSLFLNVGGTNKDPWVGADVAAVFREILICQNHIIWVKSIALGDVTTGHFKPINSRRYLNHTHESIYQFTHTGDVPVDRLAVGVPFADKSNIARRGHAADLRCAGDVWYIPYETVQSKAQKFEHPAGFPVGLPLRCIKFHGVTDGMVVLDPFLGAGTTSVAAQRLGVAGVGMEIDPFYARKTEERLEFERLRREVW
jgi:site-specific DNA-methyltransferase (adenine-specific)